MDAQRPCPDSALLAAFIDGTLGDYERTAVVSHLGECPQCRAVALTVVEFRELTASDEQWHTPVPAAPAPLGETGVRRWARAKTRAPALALAAAATIAAVVVPVLFIRSSWSARQSVSIAADAINSPRPIEARVSGGGSYAPPPSTVSRQDPSRNWQLVAAADHVRATNENDYGAPSRTAIGVAALLAGDLDDAVASLTIATAAKPDDSRLANDLAAAYYERSQRGSRPDDLPAALGAAERAVALDDTFAQAWFNRALIITALGMHAEARTAWQLFLAKDPSSPWADEARSRLQALPRTTAVADWAELRRNLVSDITRDIAERAVATHAGRARDLFENVLLKDWLADAKLGRDTRASGHRLSVLADAFEAVNQDRFYRDVVVSLAAVTGFDRRAVFVRAHEQFFAAVALVAASSNDKAAVAFERAEAQLAAVGSPYAARARLEAATTAYNLRLYRRAAPLLTSEKEAARAKGYRTLATRAAWILGMTKFGLSDFAGARVHYEEMLESTPAGDPDVYVMANVLLANLHYALGDNAPAWNHRVQAALRVDECSSPNTVANAFVSAAGHALARGHLAAALLFQSRLLGSGGSGTVPEVQLRTQRAAILHRLDQPEAALSELHLARARLPHIADRRVRSDIEADLLIVQSELEQAVDKQQALTLAEQAVAAAGEGTDLLRRSRLRMRLAETSLASGFIDRADRAAADAVAAIDRFRAFATEEVSIGASDQALSVYSRATEIALRRGDVARAFDYSERRRIHNAAALRSWSTESIRLQTIQGELGADTALAVFTQIGDTLQVWVIRRNDAGTHGIELTETRAAGLVAAHLDEVSRGISSPGMSAELYDTIIRPVQRLLTGAHQVVVVADAPYNRIAFAGLWDRRSNRYLVEDHRLVAAPSATAFLTAMARTKGRAMATTRRTSMAVATTPAARGDRTVEPFISALRSAYSGASFRRDDASTPDTVRRDLAERDVVHISAALAPNHQSPFRSRLLMVDEPGRRYSGSVSASQLAGAATMRARLVAFDARAAQRGDVSEGISGFATALLAKGVPAVVGPNVQMPASDLERTWLHFHRHYAAGTPAAESLQRAQLAALNESKRRTGAWATLTVFGSTE